MSDFSIIKNPKEENLEEIIKIYQENNIENTSNINNGFLVTTDCKYYLENSSKIYVSEKNNPTYVLITYTNKQYKQILGEIKYEKLLKNYIHGFAVMRNKNKPRKNYKLFLKQVIDEERKKSKGMWVLIAENPLNKKSKEVHLYLGWEKIGEETKQNPKMYGGKKIRWGIYTLDFNKLNIQ